MISELVNLKGHLPDVWQAVLSSFASSCQPEVELVKAFGGGECWAKLEDHPHLIRAGVPEGMWLPSRNNYGFPRP
jgi:hypothetical protein